MSQQLLFLGGVLASGIILGYLARLFLAGKSAVSIENKAKSLVLEAKEKAAALLEEIKADERLRKAQIEKSEERLIAKEETLEKRSRLLLEKEQKLDQESGKLVSIKEEVERLQKQAAGQLEKIAGLSSAEARERLMKEVEERYKNDLVAIVQKLEKEKREEIEKKSVEIITTAIQRYSRSNVSELTTSVFNLSNEDLKGKIIGREGRNIRALERAAGVEIIVDETPESIIISSFDPLRREVAKLTLEKLLKDGRIQPAKIEDKAEEAKQELNKRMYEIGEQTALEVGVIDLPKEILQLLGRLHFRTSYGQNVLTHSVEMAHVAGMIAAELGVDVEVTKRGALLHDIGKAISHEVEGTHVELGKKILSKYGIDERVIQAMQSHHEEYPFSTPESYIVAAADIISAARPGARRDSAENYIKRLEELEKIASSFTGVKNVYALSAGREVRVFVIPEKIDDFGALQLAKNIASKIQSDLKYPGEIKVNIIRELRAVEYAK